MQKIKPCLWYDMQAEEAVNFYVGLFKNSKINTVSRTPQGAAFVIEFTLAGNEYQALNGGPMFKFTEAASLSVTCEDQAEVDNYWNAFLNNGGEASQCGWLKDRWGLSWQIIPKQLGELMGDKDQTRAQRVTEAMMKMIKLDVAELQRAYDGR
ncbi:MAG: VOC family protein [Caulobacterales bacterium]